MNEDMSQFLSVFLQEAAEQMELLEQDILKLEQEASHELLQEIFRAAHTLKGSSRAMGLTSMGELTHAMEDVFDALRNNQLTVSPQLIDALFGGLDALKAMLEEVAASGNTGVDTVQLTARLRAVLTSQGTPAPAAPKPAASAPASAPAPPPPVAPAPSASSIKLTASQQSAYQDALATGFSIYKIRVEIVSDCIMKSVRALMVMQALEKVGSIIASYPDEEGLENENFDDTFEVVVATQNSPAALTTAVLTVNEIKQADTTPFSLHNDASSRSASQYKTRMNDAQNSAYLDALAVGYSVYGLRVEIVSDCIMKSVRALMVMQALEKVGSIIASYPDEEGLENENFDTTFEVVVATQNSPAALTTAALTVNEIKSVETNPWSANAAEASTAPSPTGATATPAAEPTAKPSEPTAKHAEASAEPAETSAEPAAPDKASEHSASKHGAAAHPPKVETKAAAQPQTVRVDVARLDSLLNLIGELVIDRTRIAQLSSQIERQFGISPVVEHLNDTAAHVARITDQLQDEIMKARMLPIENVFSRFPRMVRDLAQKMGKEINFIVEGKETELDRSVIEVVGDPLIHMLRNSVDHGVEMPDEREKAGKPRTGNVWLSARHQENHIVIEVKDDGKGIDPEKLRASAVKKGLMSKDAAARLSDKEAINLIFASGFSTAAVVSDVSGRGVGMDIVKSNLQKLGAIIDIESVVGKGSTFTVKLPLTLAIIRGLLVTVQGNVYALPLGSVVETLRIEPETVRHIQRQPNVVLRGKTLPLVHVKSLFPLRPAPLTLTQIEAQAVVRERVESASDVVLENVSDTAADPNLYVVVVGAANRQVGLVVDTLIGEQEVVIKTLGKFIGDIPGLSGATILGDGRMGLIVDVAGVISMATQSKGNAYAA